MHQPVKTRFGKIKRTVTHFVSRKTLIGIGRNIIAQG